MSDYLVDMENVRKNYAYFTLQDFNLKLPPGEIMGIVGPNGAGKSTCLNLLMGFIRADSGNIKVLDCEIPKHVKQVKQDVAYVSEEMRLYGDQSIEWHMHFLEKVFSKWDAQYAQHLLQQFDLKEKQLIKTLSLGQRVKATLLMSLARRPKLLVLDEPSTGLDPVARHELTNELINIMLNEENSVIFSSQFTQDVERLSDSIMFMDEGQVISLSNKESYLDKWKRIELRSDNIPPSLRGIIGVQSFKNKHSVIHSDFSDSSLATLLKAGCEIKHIQNLTLEEIFIEQITHRRKAKKEARSHA